MSNQFYNYLVELIMEYFKCRSIKNGDKFNIRLEDKAQIEFLYEAFKKKEDSKIFKYDLIDKQSYETIYLDINNINLLIVTNLNVTADFLTFIRNKIGSSKKFENSAMVAIHNSNLDSLTSGSESLQKEYMPLNPKYILKDIAKKSNDSKTLGELEKQFIKFALEKKSNNYMRT